MCTAWAKWQSTSKLHVMLVPGDLPVAALVLQLHRGRLGDACLRLWLLQEA